ncbi:hypothetical protein KXR83_25790 [Williamsia muralis]|uniref:hypothetical protein n=1 Tax=Williamsia marianensis TaxID=85044 RepID=UPI003F158D62
MTTQTVTVTEENRPNLDCQAPAINLFEVTWERKFGPGIPPALGPRDPMGFTYFAVYTPRTAEVRLLNLSPHRIDTRGINFQVSWQIPEGAIISNRYNWGLPANTLVDREFGSVPAEPSGVTQFREAKKVDGGEIISFSRDYSGEWDARVIGGAEPRTWIEPDGIDWWFADKDVRQRCGQKEP